MNSETIYNVLLDEPRSIDGKTWHGLSYQLSSDENGKIELREFGWPTKLTLWEQDGPELDTLDEATVKQMIESVLPLDESYVIPPPPIPFVETFTAEQVVSNYFSAYEIAALQRFELGLMQAQKPLGEKMSAVKTWLELLLLSWSQDPTPKAVSHFGQSPYSFAEVSAEAAAALTSDQ